jgi:hypothetical protein
MMTERGHIPGDWRAGAHGGNRRVHLFAYRMLESVKRPACGARVNASTYLPVARRRVADLCYDCLSEGAAGRG